jgi:hypothetical protein
MAGGDRRGPRLGDVSVNGFELILSTSQRVPVLDGTGCVCVYLQVWRDNQDESPYGMA